MKPFVTPIKVHQIIVTAEGHTPLVAYANTEDFTFTHDDLLAFMSGMWWMDRATVGHPQVSVTATSINGTILKKLVYLGGYGPSEVE